MFKCEDFLRNGLELWGDCFTFNDPTSSRSSQLNETHSLNFELCKCVVWFSPYFPTNFVPLACLSHETLNNP